jgi:hypothetical protein
MCCLVIGDSAGRIAQLRRRADRSCGDRKFAQSIGIEFHTPEEFFMGQKAAPFTLENPKYKRRAEARDKRLADEAKSR